MSISLQLYLDAATTKGGNPGGVGTRGDLAGEEKGRQARMAPKPIKSDLKTLISLPVLENPVERGVKKEEAEI